MEQNQDTSVLDKSGIEMQGSVANPGHFLPQEDASFEEYVKLAGGLTHDPKNTIVTISRITEGKKEIFSYKFEPVEKLPAPKAGDVVRLEDMLNNYPARRKLRNIHPVITGDSFELGVVHDREEICAPEEAQLLRDSLDNYSAKPEVKRLFNQIANYVTATGSQVIGVIGSGGLEERQIVSASLARGFSEYLNTRILLVALSGRTKLIASLDNFAEVSRQNGNSLAGLASVKVVFADELKAICKSRKLDFYIQGIIEQVKGQFDLIVLDLPAYAGEDSSVDSIVAASQCDSCLVVLGKSSSERALIDNFKADLERHRISCMGTIIV